ncbi:hemoglobin subunit beta-2-like [Megalops cyprinoides]|uniref:hemoglobin subunit beta-2-like n=1 Tax=Megalops cyprinoides TaxID=118141 RepID=UPI00186469F7|nr:hemoglobin subunit beta-2-like [Megalops cyprinoides]
MVEWTEEERKAIQTIWGKMNYDVVGPEALGRVMFVYPWTQRYFGGFGTFSSVESIMGNDKVRAHGKVVLHGLDRAVQNMDNIKETYAELSVLHSEKLHVDPDNFRLLGDCLTIVVAGQLGSAFTPEVQATWQKFLRVVISALQRQYH